MKLLKFNYKEISITKIIILMFIISLFVTIITIGFIVFSNWIEEAESTVSIMSNHLNKEMINEIERYMEVPKNMNKVNKGLFENGIVDINNSEERDKFFVNALLTHSESEVYSYSIGTITGEYYGARKNENDEIEIMRNNDETSGVSWYYSVRDDNTIGELAVIAGKFDPRSRAWYKEAIDKDTFVFSPIYKHFIMDDLTVSAAVPIYDESKNLIGVLGSHIILSNINNYLSDFADERHADIIIIERDTGFLVANSFGIKNFIETEEGNYDRLDINIIENEVLKKVYKEYSTNNQSEIDITYDNQIYHSNISDYKFDGLDWLVVSVLPENIWLTEIMNNIRLGLTLSIIALLFFSCIYYFLTHYLLKPINDLVNIQDKFAAGDLLQRASYGGRINEPKKLSEGFNKMATTVDQLVNNLEAEVKKRTIKISKRNKEIKENQDQLQLILDSTVEGICGIDQSGNCIFINKSAVEMLGYDHQDELIGLNIHNTFHHSLRHGGNLSNDECKIFQSIKSGDSVHVDDEVFWKKDQESFDVEYYTHPQIVNGELMGSVLTFLDFTERKKMEEMVYNEKEQFRTTLLSVGDAVISTDSQGIIEVMNPVAEELTGWKQSQAQGLDIEEVFYIVNEITRDRCENPVELVLEKNDIIELSNQTILIRRDQSEIPIEDSAAPIKDNKGNITGVVLVFRDFSDRKEHLEEIEYLSFHDYLTGLYNRRYISDAIQRLDTKRNIPFAIMAIDVNGLKLTNDAFGHEVGDKLLVRVAKLLREVCRDDDIVGRMGGDEFIILLPQTSRDEADRIKKRIAQATKREKMESVIISLAMGYSVKEEYKNSINDILNMADNNMYKNKLKNGKVMKRKTINMVIDKIKEKFAQEEVHTRRVSKYCVEIAKAMAFDPNEVEKLRMAGILHDIGKIIIPPEVLNNSGSLSKDELDLIRRHPETGYQILKSVDEYSDIAEDVLHHHERIDGKGYPEGLIGKEIPIRSRVLTIADAYEAMTSYRPYREVMSKEEAIAELKRCSGTQFDEEIVTIFIEKVLKK